MQRLGIHGCVDAYCDRRPATLEKHIWAVCLACATEAHLHVYQLSKCGYNKPATSVAVPVSSSQAVLLGLRHRRAASNAKLTALPLKKAVLV